MPFTPRALLLLSMPDETFEPVNCLTQIAEFLLMPWFYVSLTEYILSKTTAQDQEVNDDITLKLHLLLSG